MNISRFKQLLESTMGNVKPLLVEQTGPLSIQDDQTITLSCNEVSNITGTPIIISGRVDTDSENAKWGYRDPETDEYIEPETVVPKFTVYSEPQMGSVTGDEEIANGFYITPITQDLSNALGGVTGNVIEYFQEGSPGDPNTERFYCKVSQVSAQFKTELQKNKVQIS